MPTYAKVFARILDSTIANNWYTRHLFEDLLKLASWDGEVDLTPEAIARRTGWPTTLQDLREHLARLEAADPDSRTQEEEGRRIVKLDPERTWGWRIVNFPVYRDAQDLDRVRTLGAERVRRHRQTKCTECGSSKAACDRQVNLPSGQSCCVACADADTHTGGGHVTAGNTPKRHEDRDGDRDKDRESEAPSASGDAAGPAPVAVEDGEIIHAEVVGEEEATSSQVAGSATIRMKPPAETWDRRAAFQERWAHYVRKEKKDRAERGFLKTVRTPEDLADYDRACTHYYPHAEEKAAEDPSLVMQGGTWFGGRWREWVDGNPVRGSRPPAGAAAQVPARVDAPLVDALPAPNAWTRMVDQVADATHWLLAARLIAHAGDQLTIGVPTTHHVDEIREFHGGRLKDLRTAAGFAPLGFQVVRFAGGEA